jgi:outer membrane protein
LFLLIAVTAVSNVSSQKLGYLNSNELLAMHPYVLGADSILLIYQNQLMADGQQLVEKFQKNYENYMVEANAGNLSKIKMQEIENELTQEQNSIREFETEMQQKILKKREELFTPILNNIQEAINTVGKENEYTFIFDISTGSILFAEMADDILPLVKQKLGI